MKPRPIPLLTLLLGGALATGCATTQPVTTTPTGTTATAERVQMEPITIEATGAGETRRVEAYDAGSLFEQAGADLQAEKWDAAGAGYDRLVAKFPDSRYVVSALYNGGLACEGKKDWSCAVSHYRTLVEKHRETRDALDALFRMGQCLAELGNWAASGDAFAQVLEHKEIGVEDRIEATTRRGLAQYNVKDAPAAERTFREALNTYRAHEAEERIDNVFFVAMSQYYLGEIAHDEFRALPIRLPESQMKKDLEAKAQRLLISQARYVDVARIRHPAWATAAGYQMACLYKEMYEAIMDAPVPKMSDEYKQVYLDELKKTIEPLLRRAIHAHELTQQVAERNGVDNEWVKKSTEQLEQLRSLVTPEIGGPPPAAAPSPPPRSIPARPELEKMQPPPTPPRREGPQRVVM